MVALERSICHAGIRKRHRRADYATQFKLAVRKATQQCIPGSETSREPFFGQDLDVDADLKAGWRQSVS
jgi:hypothetical protein